jgi:ubiquinone/menaquinone biosynthesis C-methylase UbiE
MPAAILEALDIDGFRTAFLEFTREAYLSIPPIAVPRILDAGCGTGVPTLELARLSDGEIVAVDADQKALDTLRLRIEERDLSDRVQTICCSIFETGFAPASFDIVWEEGVFHLLEVDRALEESMRLLKCGGFLVMFETNAWIETHRGRFAEHGFDLFRQLPLPPGCWWTRYYQPLEQRISQLRGNYQDPKDREVLSRFEREIENVKADVTSSDGSFVIVRRPV